MWSKLACLPNFYEDMKGRLFIDILNEPDSQRQGWQKNDGGAAGGVGGVRRSGRGGGGVQGQRDTKGQLASYRVDR